MLDSKVWLMVCTATWCVNEISCRLQGSYTAVAQDFQYSIFGRFKCTESAPKLLRDSAGKFHEATKSAVFGQYQAERANFRDVSRASVCVAANQVRHP